MCAGWLETNTDVNRWTDDLKAKQKRRHKKTNLWKLCVDVYIMSWTLDLYTPLHFQLRFHANERRNCKLLPARTRLQSAPNTTRQTKTKQDRHEDESASIRALMTCRNLLVIATDHVSATHTCQSGWRSRFWVNVITILRLKCLVRSKTSPNPAKKCKVYIIMTLKLSADNFKYRYVCCCPNLSPNWP